MSCYRCMFVTASLLLTATFVCVGISFFAPYWLANTRVADETKYFDDNDDVGKKIQMLPHRGLWAQCGDSCIWFWQHDYRLQKKLLTELKWPLATQVLYFIAAFLILVCEILARLQFCSNKDRSRTYIILGIIVLVSAVLQTAALGAFGGGASKDPYDVSTDPKKLTKYMSESFDAMDMTKDHNKNVYLGWCFWLAVVGDMASVAVGVLFLLAGCCLKA